MNGAEWPSRSTSSALPAAWIWTGGSSPFDSAATTGAANNRATSKHLMRLSPIQRSRYVREGVGAQSLAYASGSSKLRSTRRSPFPRQIPNEGAAVLHAGDEPFAVRHERQRADDAPEPFDLAHFE